MVLGRYVVVDAVNDSDAARQTWRNAADRTAAALRFVMLNCSGVKEHRRRLEGRRRGLRNVPEPAWEQVLARASGFEPWTDDCLMVDTHQPLEAVISEVHQRLEYGA